MAWDAQLDVVVTDAAVEFTYTVTNTADAPVELEFRSGTVADIAVSDDATEVWRWSDGRLFTQAIRTETLAPGDSIVHEGVWDEPTPGRYTAEASLDATTLDLVERAAFEVTATTG